MQYVRNISDSVSTAWNSINPATLSGAIDVIVVEHQDGSLYCSPFHVRFGKFSLLRPYEKKVEFKVNGVRQNYAMKLGEGGEAFFIFETTDAVPQSLQTSPLSSPTSSPPLDPDGSQTPNALQEPDFLQLDGSEPSAPARSLTVPRPGPTPLTIPGAVPTTPIATSPELSHGRPTPRGWPGAPSNFSDNILPPNSRVHSGYEDLGERNEELENPHTFPGSHSPQPLALVEAKNGNNALLVQLQEALSIAFKVENINMAAEIVSPNDLKINMAESSEIDALKAERVARNVLSVILTEELGENYDIGALIDMDIEGNLRIFSSEEAKESEMKKMVASLRPSPNLASDAMSDPGYASDDSTTSSRDPVHRRTESDVGMGGVQTPPTTPGSASDIGQRQHHSSKNYAKTLRLTSEQLKELDLKPGENSMSFTVNRATCQSNMYLWKYETPVVISDIDGTITKSDALGHVLNMIGRDWTHTGVAKLYNDIVSNGYNIMYLTSRSVGQADTTRAYLNGIVQDGFRLPRGPTILSPDRTMAALRREIYLRKPHVFKMATLRDIRSLYGPENHCFYAGFGNRLTDQISYRCVDVPRNRIFTINSNAEVSLDLLSLNKLKLSYVNMGEVVDHYFPPVSTLVKGGGIEYTDFTYWRDMPLDFDDFSASESDEGEEEDEEEEYAEDEEEIGQMGDSYLSGDYDDPENTDSVIQEDEDADAEDDEEEDDSDDDEIAAETEDDVIEDAKHTQAVPHGVKPKSGPRVAVADTNAELITGLKNLRVDEETKQY
ncbi:LNS2-domain-containing protein [Xylariaceae sp. FL0016]|nr:LNS2-domain-containing protein [Xylariaceae sp. FL0016]